MVWVTRAREPCSAHSLQFHLNSPDRGFSGQVQNNFAGKEVQVGVVCMAAVQKDCRGHGGASVDRRGLEGVAVTDCELRDLHDHSARGSELG